MTDATRTCPKCGATYGANVIFCPNDRTLLDTSAGEFTGKIIADRYRVISQIGEGGMGRVYLAEHVHMKRKCAVKFLSPELAGNEGALKRFIREASNASRIDHPNVVTIYDFGETQDRSVYLAMEFVEGETLRKRIERDRAMPRDVVASIIRQTASALQAAHALGIVHRDLKPDNIMLVHRDGELRVKVVDFGIAKARGAEQKVTVTGAIVGTPDYMSPEQLTGDDVDGTTDQYALALVAVKMLTGKLPFAATTSIEAMTSRLTTAPMPLRQLRTDVAWPQQLQDVIGRALAGDAAQRFPSVVDFSRAFDKAVGAMSGALSATAPDLPKLPEMVPPTRKSDAAGRRRIARPWMAAGALAILAVAGGSVSVMLMRRSPATTATSPPRAGSTPIATREGAPGVVSQAGRASPADTARLAIVPPKPDVAQFSKAEPQAQTRALDTTSAAKVENQARTPETRTRLQLSSGAQSPAEILSRARNALNDLDYPAALDILRPLLARDDVATQETIAGLQLAAAALYPDDPPSRRPDTAAAIVRRLVSLGSTSAEREYAWPGLDSLFAAANQRSRPAREAPASPTMTASDIAAELSSIRQLVTTDAPPTQLASAVTRANGLLARVSARSDSIRILSVRAQAHALQDDQPSACRTLALAVALAKGTSVESALTGTANRLGCP